MPQTPTNIHPTAVIAPGTEISPDAVVGPFCYVGPNVRIGAGTRLVSHVSVMGPTTIGTGNTIWPHTTLGADPQDLKFHGEHTELILGNNNDIRESVTIHRGTTNGGGVTRVGSDNLLMVGVHVAHDCIIGDHITIANNVLFAGHVHVHDHAALAGGVAVHHYVTIGQFSFIGGLSAIVHDVPPFMIVDGHPPRVRGPNVIALERHRFPPEQIHRLKDAYRILFRGAGGEESTGCMTAGLEKLEGLYPEDECVTLLIQFMRNVSIGVFGRYREAIRQDNRRRNPVK